MFRSTDVLYQTPLLQEYKAEDAMPINEEILSSVFTYLSKEGLTRTAQPILIIGEAGSGKTYLLKRIIKKIEESEGMAIRSVLFDSKVLFSTDDMWNQCAEQLNLQSSVDVFNDIISWQEKKSCRVVLFVDNIQYYFNRTDSLQHYGLRGKLNRPGAPILIATANEVLTAFTDYQAAFFDGFKLFYIKPVSVNDIRMVLGADVNQKRLHLLWDYLPKTVRSLFILSNILTQSKDNVMDLIMLRDYFSMYYQAKYELCVTQIQRILSVLSTSDQGLSLQGIREKIKQDNGKISPYLKMMADQKLIEKVSKTQRGAIYKISDKLFLLWLKSNTL